MGVIEGYTVYLIVIVKIIFHLIRDHIIINYDRNKLTRVRINTNVQVMKPS